MKSINNSSLHFKTCASVLELGRRRLPLALTNGRGAPVASAMSARNVGAITPHTKEELSPGRSVDDAVIRHSDDLHDASQLFVLIFARENRYTGIQLGKDAAQRPHVDGHSVVHAQNNFRTSIESRLYVRVHYTSVLPGHDTTHLSPFPNKMIQSR